MFVWCDISIGIECKSMKGVWGWRQILLPRKILRIRIIERGRAVVYGG